MGIPRWLFLGLFMIASYRVTRFLVFDQWPPLVWFRRKVTKDREQKESTLAYILGTSTHYGCPWCMSIWVSGVGTLGLALYVTYVQHEYWWMWYTWVIVWLASSTVSGFLGNKDQP